jgi:hypothetical protein
VLLEPIRDSDGPFVEKWWDNETKQAWTDALKYSAMFRQNTYGRSVDASSDWWSKVELPAEITYSRETRFGKRIN